MYNTYNMYNIYKIYNICNMPTYIYIYISSIAHTTHITYRSNTNSAGSQEHSTQCPGADAYPRPRTCWDDRMSDGTSDGTMESLTTVKNWDFMGFYRILWGLMVFQWDIYPEQEDISWDFMGHLPWTIGIEYDKKCDFIWFNIAF